MWAWLPDAVVEHLAELAPAAALPTLALLEQRCHPSTSARLAILYRLKAPPFLVGGRLLSLLLLACLNDEMAEPLPLQAAVEPCAPKTRV